ncbi:hypothetical protein TPADAL_0927a [Treponema pallidum subsp. pallidum DAL-1]|uniref:Uncharacterized protein n=2 Tax=Treponema pallidum TaxID=160 RepID=A0AAU8RNX1_TREPL|nr:hypothetical protein TPESAMD_0927a [Treponema pallidum subsp. pertenue str. SamoaD]AEZ59134.1 hypothetical protein TPECDC2_0927a [Treponema pallidum subsp. pertenue str. CDC2]AEZ60202.1 hypothetical protein TPEGAU_0927a [Treponema pallidum subsp. pertenue str. Gauthier]AEZ61261.1 hypothetical protein TPADAL_0927a [Treponema pallidum subsp. pallidum DAL-1]AGK84585.1 hypothetical protein TPFB_0927a [Treponema pallidum str. Fribourg-Blanc]AJB40962.1 hypothetical protein TENDBA_0927a [Treponema
MDCATVAQRNCPCQHPRSECLGSDPVIRITRGSSNCVGVLTYRGDKACAPAEIEKGLVNVHFVHFFVPVSVTANADDIPILCLTYDGAM